MFNLAQRSGVQFILDLADTNEEIQGYYQNACIAGLPSISVMIWDMP